MARMRFLLACLLASLSINVYASAETDVWQVLQKAAFAARELSYQGIFVYQIGSKSKSVQITHTFGSKGEFARNVMLDGPPRELLSLGNDLVIYNQKKEKVIIEKRRGQNMFPAIIPTNLDAIKDSYQLRSAEMERVAGRQAQMLVLESKDNLRYSYRLWVDLEYGLLLKSVMFNSNNEIMENIAFSQLGLFNSSGFDWFQPKIDTKKKYVMEDEVVTAADTAVAAVWTLKQLPAGFHKVERMLRMVHGNAIPVTHIVFSDGLASVSLFVEPLSKAVKPKADVKPRHSIVGNTSFYVNVTNGYQVTAVGEVPEATVAQIASAVVFKK
jgi:sigma-E factor negative regulatory protein RseB